MFGKCFAFCLISFVSIHNCFSANDPDSTRQKSCIVFFEKIYIHTDRALYSEGEDIWYQAYIINAQTNTLSNISRNLYVELISPDSKIISRQVLRIERGSVQGDLKLKDSLPEGIYRLRAYTAWMLNFGTNFVFEKDIKILSLLNIKPKTKEILTDVSQIDICFLPEGGSLINDVWTTVSFKAIDALGKSCMVNGYVSNSKGDTITTFNSWHRGMGTFGLKPISSEIYTAHGTVAGQAFHKTLPQSLLQGYSLHASSSDTMVSITVATNDATLQQNRNQPLILQIQSHGIPQWGAKLFLKKNETTIRVPKRILLEGVARISLWEPQTGRYHCERLFFVNGRTRSKLSMRTNKIAYKPRDSVMINIHLSDFAGKPAKGAFSLSAVDASEIPDNTSNIESYLLLESEIRGNIENIQEYFDTTNINRFRQLDLLLSTQGWRDFLWKQIADSAIRVHRLAEPGISVSGRVRDRFFDKPIPNASVSFTMLGAKQNKYMTVKTDSLGRFCFDGIVFYGKKLLTLVSKDPKGKDIGWILVDSLYSDTLSVDKQQRKKVDSANMDYPNQTNYRYKMLKNHKLSDTVKLAEFTISAKNSRAEQQEFDQRTFGMIDYDFKIKETDYGGLADYLMDKLPKVTQTIPDEAWKYPTGHVLLCCYPYSSQMNIAPNSYVHYRRPQMILNGVPKSRDIKSEIDADGDGDKDAILDILYIEEDQVYSLSIQEIERILISSWPINPDPVFPGINMGGYTISVYTKPNYYPEKNQFYKQTLSLQGYYQQREFYSPKYPAKEDLLKPDFRTTLYWAPQLEPNKDGDIRIKFWNPDTRTKVRIEIEGITSEGQSIYRKGFYEIK